MTCGKKILIVLAAALAVAGPAYAITGGTPDGQGHPAVGLLLADAGPAGFQPDCSGALVAPDVFVTAAALLHRHGVEPRADHLRRAGFALVEVRARDRIPRSGVQHGQEGSARPRGRQAAGAGHRRRRRSACPRRAWSTRRRSGRRSSRTWATATSTGRSSSTASAASRSRTSRTPRTPELRLAEHPGGVCFGDSGGPRLFGSTILAVTSTGNKNCTGQSLNYRLDTPSARAFLAQFVAVP